MVSLSAVTMNAPCASAACAEAADSDSKATPTASARRVRRQRSHSDRRRVMAQLLVEDRRCDPDPRARPGAEAPPEAMNAQDCERQPAPAQYGSIRVHDHPGEDLPLRFPRSSGLLLHPTSLPGPFA